MTDGWQGYHQLQIFCQEVSLYSEMQLFQTNLQMLLGQTILILFYYNDFHIFPLKAKLSTSSHFCKRCGEVTCLHLPQQNTKLKQRLLNDLELQKDVSFLFKLQLFQCQHR